MRKKLLIAAVAVVAVAAIVAGVLGFSACSTADFTIGIMQAVEHDALSKANTAFQEELSRLIEADGYTVDYKYNNAQGSTDLISGGIETFINSSVDLIYAIATPAAQTASGMAGDSEIPVIFNAVTDPVGDKIVGSLEHSDTNVTGVSDINPIADQVTLMQYLLGGSAEYSDFSVGVMYTTSEGNSQYQKNLVAAACAEKGIRCVEFGVSGINEISTQMEAVRESGVDILYLPTDNLLASNVNTLHSLNISLGLNLPIVSGEVGMNDLCGVATISVDYSELGRIAAQMAYEILIKKADPGKMPTRSQDSGYTVSINESVCTEIGFTINEQTRAFLDTYGSI